MNILDFSGAGAMDQFSFKVAQSLINNDGPAIEIYFDWSYHSI